MTIGQRLKKFVDQIYKSHREFSDVIGITPQMLSRYIAGRVLPKADILIKFHKAGLSIDWLFSGRESMTIDKNNANKNLTKSMEKSVLPHDRLKKWITDNYSSILNYSFLINYDFEKLNEFLDDGSVPDPSFIHEVKMSGCSIKWLTTGEGVEYEDNYFGNILRRRAETPDQDTKTDHKIDLRKINDLTTSEFYDFIHKTMDEKNKKKEIKDDDK